MKIRHKLTGAFLVFTLCVTFLFYLRGLSSQDRLFRGVAGERLTRIERSFSGLEENDAKMLLATLEAVRCDRQLKAAYLKGGRDELYRRTLPLFEAMKSSYGITDLSFILPGGRVFLRMDDRTLYGDRIKTAALEKAGRSLLPAWDMGTGRTAFVLRAVAPYFDRGRLIGYVAMSEGINHFLDSLEKEEPGSEFAILAEKKYLDRDEWRRMRRQAGLRDNWNDLKDHVVLAATGGSGAASCFPGASLERLNLKNGNLFERLRSGGRTFICGGFGLKGPGGRPIGAVLALIDISRHVALGRKANESTLLLSIFLFLATFSAGVAFARYITGPIQKLADAAKAIGRGELDRRVGVRSSDEIGELAGAFNEMAQMRKSAEDELRGCRDELEVLVGERTRALAESEERYRTIIEAAQEGIWVMDAAERIIFANERIAGMLGYEKGQLLGRPVTDFIDAELVPEFHARCERRKQGVAEKFDFRLRAADGSDLWVIISSSPRFDADGEFLGWISMIVDITERRRLESIAEAANLMENTGYIFSGIRHEIANPVATAMITLSVLRKKIKDFREEQIGEYIDRALEQMSRLDFLIKSLKSFNMFEAVKPENVELSGCIEKFLALVRNDAKVKGIKIEYSAAPDTGWAYIDERAFQQVMLNIFTNAIDALEGAVGPRIKISTARVKKLIMVRVEDNGRGMNEKQVRELFKPFATTKPHGTGLGLMIVKKMLSRMQGHIEITSELNMGTMVDIFIPAGGEVF